eukprot:m.27404 g.27404  ORF g.27404 m.27404 type:complete len:679 (-) comp7891_c0_seq1:1251-3287(-)
MASTKEKIELRPYQKILSQQCLEDDGNYIVTLPTGTGKTMIAFTLMCEALKRHQMKKIVFLCTTQILAEQQALYFTEFKKQNADIESVGVEKFIGTMKITNNMENRVMFVTPAKFYSFLNQCYDRKDKEGFEKAFGRYSMFIFDECHNAVTLETSNNKSESNHFYHEILRLYKEGQTTKAQQSRPKIIGLTASPGDGQDCVRRLADMFEGQLTLLSETEQKDMMKYCKIPSTEKIALYEDPGCEENLNILTKILDDVNVRKKSLQKYGMFDDISVCEKLTAVWRIFGWGDKNPMMHDDEIKKIKLFYKFEEYNTQVQNLYQSKVSPVIQRVENIIEEALPTNKKISEFRAIVFVKNIVSAQLLAKHLNEKLENVYADYIVGRAEDKKETQQNKIEEFRKGNFNVLVATSVVEEGIDVRSCKLVIRTEPPQTIITNIQSRGRARYPEAEYKILCVNSDEKTEVIKLEEKEEVLNKYLQSRPTVTRKPCTTSWSDMSPPPILHKPQEKASSKSPVTELKEYLEKKYGKAEVKYTEEKVGNGFVGKCTYDGEVFEGELRGNKREAKASAAMAALEALKQRKQIQPGTLHLDDSYDSSPSPSPSSISKKSYVTVLKEAIEANRGTFEKMDAKKCNMDENSKLWTQTWEYNGQVFEGIGTSKSKAKDAAAKDALEQLFPEHLN